MTTKKKRKQKPKAWRVLKHGSLFAIVDERDDLIADVYSNQSDALTIAASRESLRQLQTTKKILTEYFEFREGRGFGSIFDEKLKGLLDDVCIAIAKAERGVK